MTSDAIVVYTAAVEYGAARVKMWWARRRGTRVWEVRPHSENTSTSSGWQRSIVDNNLVQCPTLFPNRKSSRTPSEAIRRAIAGKRVAIAKHESQIQLCENDVEKLKALLAEHPDDEFDDPASPPPSDALARRRK